MKRLLPAALMLLLPTGARADALYYVGAEYDPHLPLKWLSGLDAVYNDGVIAAGSGQSLMTSGVNETVTPPSPLEEDLVSGTLTLDFNSHFYPSLSKKQQAVVLFLMLLASKEGIDGLVPVDGYLGNIGLPPTPNPPDPSEWEAICSCSFNHISDAPPISVPEPSPAVLAGVAAAGLLRRRRNI